MDGLKLFVLGETSANPEEWGGYGNWALVLARNSAEAVALASEAGSRAIEISLDVPKVLVFRSEDYPD
jgi:hypothetical protein